MNSRKSKGNIAGIFIFLFIVACSTQNHSTLSFFFDGVTNPEELRQAAMADSMKAAADTSLFLAQAKKPELLFHQPFLEKKCADCHNQGRMGSLNKPMPGLCYQCHTDFGTQYLYEHGPSVGGYCSQCHNPHKSEEEKLLQRTGKELCLHCHDVVLKSENPFHDTESDMECMSCHNPHGSNNHSMLNPGTCYQCHENFTENYKVVHGPVASEYCTECHVPHRTGIEKLLVRTGRDLCLRCHDNARMLAIKNHYGTEKLECTICHNPHGGNERFMFNQINN